MRRKLIDHIKQYWVIYLSLSCVYLAGIIFGSIGVGALNEPEGSQLVKFFDSLISNQPVELDQQFLIQLARDNFIMMALIWILGLTIIGTPLIYLIVFTRGFVLGFTISFIVGAKGAFGLGLVVITVVAPAILGIPMLLLGAGLATIFSFLLLRGKTTGESLRREFMYYSVATAIVSLGSVAVGVTQGYFSLLGVHLFGLGI